MNLYIKVQDVALRDFEFLRLISDSSLDVLVTKVTDYIKYSEGEDCKEEFINLCITEQVAHLVSKGLLLELQ